jgi:oligopeptide transport system ATP-binding protein
MPLLDVQNLKVHFPVKGSALSGTSSTVKAVDGVSLSVAAGEAVGLVGESGCGKSTLGRSILRLLEPTSGRIFFDGQDITTLGARALRPLRRQFQMIFQDPFHSLNPRMTLGQSIGEALVIHGLGNSEAARQTRVAELLQSVGLTPDVADRFPHQFSGGQRQRIGIARALYKRADVLIFDEATSALDSDTETAVMSAIEALDREVTLLMIAHLTTTLRNCDLIVELADGRIRRQGTYADLLLDRDPAHAGVLGA